MKIKFLLCGILPLLFFSSSSFAQQTNKPKAVINHVAIYVVDIKKSGNFYMNIIGLDSIPEPFNDGRHIWLNIGPGIAMHIIQGAPERKEYYKNQHTCFSVQSVENFCVLLKNNLMDWEDRDGNQLSITTRVDGVKQIWLQDPDGYWVEINDAKN